MLDRLKRLFSTVEEAEPGQQQREALLDLLIWTMYADNVLSLPENNKLDQITTEMTWDAVMPIGQYLSTAIARIRSLRDDPAKADAYLDVLAQQLGDQPMRQRAYDAACELAQADGQVTAEEEAFLKTLRERFVINA